MPRIANTCWRFVGLIVLLGLFCIQAIAASPHNSVTFDEQYHITLGYTYLKTGDLRLHRNQGPPLFELLTSLPLLLRSDLVLPLEHPAYALWGDIYLFSDEFLWQANTDAQGMVHTGRIVTAGLGALLGLLLFTWGRELYGEKAGWLAAFLLAFDPNLIAHAIPTVDLGLALFVTLAVWRLWHYLHCPTGPNVLLAGLALGAALGTKFIGVVLLPALALILLIYPAGIGKQRLLRRVLAFSVMLGVAWLVLWLTYGFQFGPINGKGLPVPASLYFESFVGMFLKSSEGRANFLNGQVALTGWPHYFLVTLLLKTPVPVLLLSIVALFRWPWRHEWRQSSSLILPAVFLFAAASLGKLQLGYRYILPALPFLFLIAARVVTLSWPRWIQVTSPVLAAWLIIGTITIFPHYLSYFNELAGGPAEGYQHLVDSNLDWGQDLPALKKWIDTHRPDSLHLGFFGSALPERYGVKAIDIPSYPLHAYGHEVEGFTSYSLEPGLYAISATLLRIGLVFKQFDIYQAFHSMKPIDRAGYSILIYDVRYPPDAEIDRAVIVGPLASDVPADVLGARPDHPLRAKWCAWPECFVLTPHPARYIVRDWMSFAPDLAELARAQATSVRAIRIGPTEYTVAELDATSLLQSKLDELQFAPASTPDQARLKFPILFENGLSLIGYETKPAKTFSPSQALEINTYWQVAHRSTPPMAIFVHLLDPQGNLRGQHDGLGAALTTLEPDDVVIQHHSVTLDAQATPGTYQLQVGLYNPVTMSRFNAHPPGLSTVDRVLLSTVEVTR